MAHTVLLPTTSSTLCSTPLAILSLRNNLIGMEIPCYDLLMMDASFRVGVHICRAINSTSEWKGIVKFASMNNCIVLE